MNTQEYIIILIAIVALVIVGKKVMALFQKKSSPCDGCSGCDLSAHANHTNKCK